MFLAITPSTLMGCASTATKEGTGEYFDDAVITAKVKAAMLDQPSLKSFDIEVVTFKGTVQLAGLVTSRATMNQAVELARRVNGVKSVKNEMRFK